jgi:microcystin degradation protein MlrC
MRTRRPDAVYLDLHGAMVTEHLDDGEGELLERVRQAVGERVPIVVSLDLHANVTPAMLQLADVLVAYRTYPHIDMADTGARAALLLRQLFEGMSKPSVAVRRIPFIIPINAQCTDLQPLRGVYDALARREGGALSTLSFTPGFPAADIEYCGGTVFAYSANAAAAQQAADAIADLVERAESEFDYPVFEADEAVQRAMRAAQSASKPVVIADTQDNPGVGGDSDTTGMLRALLKAGAERTAVDAVALLKRSAVGIMVDAEVAHAAHRAGVGKTVEAALGGKHGLPGDTPLQARFLVESLSDGKFVCKGPFYRGARMDLGPSACLRIDGVRIVVACVKVQCADQEMFRYVGIEPTEQAILVNKSSVHFRADFAPIAQEIISAKAPGAMLADPGEYRWTKLRRGVRLKPNGRAL